MEPRTYHTRIYEERRKGRVMGGAYSRYQGRDYLFFALNGEIKTANVQSSAPVRWLPPISVLFAADDGLTMFVHSDLSPDLAE
jgi:hypothetical protein